MSALQSLINPPRAQSNRRNAQHSTGPRTEAGKARSRRNAVRHGLTGAGLALPGEEAAAVAERFAAFHDQFQPTTPLGAYYVHRIALATVRTDRAERHEVAALALQVAHAAEEFDRHRTAEADQALATLRAGDARAARRSLLRTPEGITRLIDELLGLRRCLGLTQPLWSLEHGARLDACLGIAPDTIIPSRAEALTTAALGGSDDLLTPREHAAIAATGRSAAEWAVGQLLGTIDHEVAALRADLAAIDPATVAADRLGALDRALFDPSPTAQLARRYEAAARRDLDRSLRLLRELEPVSESEPEALIEPEPEPEPSAPTIAPAPPPGPAIASGREAAQAATDASEAIDDVEYKDRKSLARVELPDPLGLFGRDQASPDRGGLAGSVAGAGWPVASGGASG